MTRDDPDSSHCNAVALWGVLLILMSAWACFSAPLARADTIILSVKGAIEEEAAEFTRPDLEALEQVELHTGTSVTHGQQVFRGFLLRDLLERLGAKGEEIVARALNDYEIVIPMSDVRDYDVIGALSMDGEPLSPRDKGPIWIVYPRDQHEELEDIRFDMRWVWQLHELEVR